MFSNAPYRLMRCLLAAAALAGSGLAQAGTVPGGAIDYGPLAAAVPSLSEWSLALMALLLAVVAYRVLRGRVGGRLMSNLLVAGAAVAAGFSGVGLVREAEALSAVDVNMSSTSGGTLNGTFWTRLNNTTGIPLRIIDIRTNRGVIIESPPPDSPECTIGTVVAPGARCNIEFRTEIRPL